MVEVEEWKRGGRVQAGTCGVQRQLADRNAHSAGALIAKSEDALPVAHDDRLDVVQLRMRENLFDSLYDSLWRGRHGAPSLTRSGGADQ